MRSTDYAGTAAGDPSSAVGIGIILAIGAATFARSLLFGLTPSDPVTIVIATRPVVE